MEQVRVLMVEDNDNDAVLINRELARLTPPPAVQHVRTKPAFATALEGFAPHAILSDHNIPGFGGWEALEIAQRARPDVPFILVNRATAHVYGTTVDALVGKTDGDFNRNTEEVAHFLRDDRDVMSSGQPKIIAEEPVTNPAGETRWFQTIKVPLRSPAEGTATLLGVATEITERKRLEEQLLQSQKMEAVGQLAGGVAHDFNNILTAIVGYTDLLAAELVGQEHQLEDLEEIRKAARRAAALTRQLLAFSRKQVLEPRIIDVNDVVMNLDKMLRSLISENIELKTMLADDVNAARVDPNQLEQVIMNLAIN